MDTQATTRSPRHKARNAFWLVYCAGFLLGLLAVGADVTVERVTGWAAIGTFAVLVTYWVARWRWS